ncbi:hypothetical protein EDI28_03625 [Photobacterium chitinilyticum]|uniref:Uncharacterized protein n=1 Tax=Photobacterium chitinilyticum TaxID=2485123 RepID=A0A3S3S394_9GAMM|nr:hypothetical protein EDI28_03625 [Photobacterium chitinilyticum]
MALWPARQSNRQIIPLEDDLVNSNLNKNINSASEKSYRKAAIQTYLDILVQQQQIINSHY